MGLFAQLFTKRSYTPPAALLSGMTGRAVTAAGVVVNERTALGYGAVMAATRVLAESVAMLPLTLYRRLGDGGRERAVDHALYDVLRYQPNGAMDAFAFWDLCVTHLVLWGNFFAEIEYNGRGQVIGLWPLHPGKMRVKMEEGERKYFYGVGSEALPARKVFHVMGVAKNGLVGESLLAAARNAIGLGIAAEQYGAGFFASGAKPPVILEYPGKLGPEGRENLRQSWEEAHGGAGNAHRVAVLEEGLTAKVIGIPPDDAQFLETRKFQVTEIARIFRVPSHLLADLDRATFSNIEQQSLEFVVYSLSPWLVRIERAVLAQLLTTQKERNKYFANFVVNALLRGDMDTRFKAYATARQWGWMSRNDVRRLENMNPIPGGDDYLTPMNMMVLGDRSLDQQREEAPTTQREMREARAEAQDGEKVPAAAVARHRLAGAFAPTMRDVAQRIVNREVTDVRNATKRLLRKGNRHDWLLWLREFYGEENHCRFVRDYLASPFGTYKDLILQYVAEEVGDEPAAENMEQFTGDYLAVHSNRWCRDHRVAVEAAAEGVDDDEAAAEAVLTALDEGKENWADDFTRQHVVQFNNALAVAAYGVLRGLRKQWAAFGENCPYCNSLNGVTVELEFSFVAEGDELDGGEHGVWRSKRNVGHPPLHRGCDCMVVSG